MQKKLGVVTSFQVSEAIDVTKIPNEIEAKLTEYDEDNAVRPTIIHVDDTWTKNSKKSLLSEYEQSTLSVEQQSQEVPSPISF